MNAQICHSQYGEVAPIATNVHSLSWIISGPPMSLLISRLSTFWFSCDSASRYGEVTKSKIWS